MLIVILGVGFGEGAFIFFVSYFRVFRGKDREGRYFFF